MGFTHPAEVLSNPQFKFSKKEKQLATNSLIVLLWISWEFNCKKWIEAGDVANLYVGALLREQSLISLLSVESGVYGRTA